MTTTINPTEYHFQYTSEHGFSLGGTIERHDSGVKITSCDGEREDIIYLSHRGNGVWTGLVVTIEVGCGLKWRELKSDLDTKSFMGQAHNIIEGVLKSIDPKSNLDLAVGFIPKVW